MRNFSRTILAIFLPVPRSRLYLLRLIVRSAYPLIPDEARDCTNQRCATMKTTSIGSWLISVPAMSSGMFVLWAPWNEASPSGSV